MSTEDLKKAKVYVIQSDSGRIKIGHSVDPIQRLMQIQSSNGHELKLIYETDFYANFLLIERVSQKILKPNRVKGEWFHVTSIEAIDAVKQAVWMVANEKYENVFYNKKYKYDKVSVSITGKDKELLYKIKNYLEKDIGGNASISIAKVLSGMIHFRAKALKLTD